jgi:uncharacterized protein (DUF1499 family)
MLRRLRNLVLLLAAIVALPTVIFVATSREEYVLGALYERVFGAPDLGPVTFETLDRGGRQNDALACPPGLCRATADFDPGVFPLSEEELRARVTRLALAEPHTVPAYRHTRAGLPTQDRYVQRSRLMQYPDTIDIRFIPLSETTATLAIYSRSQIGRSDFGVNLARIRRWTDRAALGLAP